MKFLILAVVFSTLNHLLFKAFSRLNITLLTAVCLNYAVCVCIGCVSSGMSRGGINPTEQAWFPISVVQGILLFFSFLLMGRTTYRCGVSIASLATRLSIAIPTIAAFFLYADTIGISKMAGIAAALAALFLSATTPSSDIDVSSLPHPFLPVSLFVVFGIHSALLKYVQARFLTGYDYHSYIMASFWFAFLASVFFVCFQIMQKKLALKREDIFAGILLGTANYGSVYCLIKTLAVPGWQSSQIFPTISILVVALSTLLARIAFREKIHNKVAAALIIGAAGIIFVNL